jgi:hypothetical protein
VVVARRAISSGACGGARRGCPLHAATQDAHGAVGGEDTRAFASVYANTSPNSGPIAAADVENGKLGRTEEL